MPDHRLVVGIRDAPIATLVHRRLDQSLRRHVSGIASFLGNLPVLALLLEKEKEPNTTDATQSPFINAPEEELMNAYNALLAADLIKLAMIDIQQQLVH